MYENAGDGLMKHYRVVYEKIDTRSVWIEVPDHVDEKGAEDIFLQYYTRYDDESDEYNTVCSNMNVIGVNQIDEDGNDIDTV